MGITFANITVQGQMQDVLVNYLKQAKRNAYISPAINNFVVVYDEDSEFNLVELSNLSLQISRDFSCLTFPIIINDESVFSYELYQNGNLIDEYCSSAEEDLFPEGGDAQKLCTILGVKQSINKVRPILRELSTENVYLFASQRHKDLVRELSLPLWSTSIIKKIGYKTPFFQDGFF